MVHLLFGIFIIVFILFVYSGFFTDFGNITSMLSEFDVIPSIFLLIAVILIIYGLIKVIRNAMTETSGEKCYGIISGLKPTNTSIMDKPILNAVVNLYVESENKVLTIEESIGLDSDKYAIGTFVELKYYKGDINFVGVIDKTLVPANAMEHLAQFDTPHNKGM